MTRIDFPNFIKLPTVIRANVMKGAAWLKGFTPDMLPGVMINTSATDFAPLSQPQMMRFKGEKWELFGDIISGEVTTN